ncbi:hypothetical protein [Actinokineospora sp. NBRC 105648]|uniref:hypothetical protein n=1 Tax=Actinokineospora sp. NBRC 105648 TaxID=3032206 RepID=UPI0024A03847|nr:hypothetical protein [Actinokineospora sp. NBRC 105648]GLZ37967.1 hypothetical protein Acsp05_15910 [Actinokineospora sp. NBRC 105648]
MKLATLVASCAVAGTFVVSAASTAGAVTQVGVTCWSGSSQYVCNSSAYDFYDEENGRVSWRVNNQTLQYNRNRETTGARLCTPGELITADVYYQDGYGSARASDTVICNAGPILQE